MAKGMARQVPLARLGQSEEIAQAVTYLASDNRFFVTGSELRVDAG